jgi:type I restriction enzyme S subunit
MKRAPIASKADMFPDLPQSWEYADVQTLYDLNLIIDYADGNHGSLYPRSSEFGESGVKFVTARDIANGRVSWNGCALLNEDRAGQLTKGWAQGGDVLLTHNATVGRVARVEADAGKFLLGTSVTFYRLNEEFINPSYFYHVLCSPIWQGQLEAIMEQTTRNQVSIQKQAFFRIPLPPLAEQRRIVAKVDQLMAFADELEKQLAASRGAAAKLTEAMVSELAAAA